MVYFIQANTMNAAFEALAQKVKETEGRKLILVPDRFTLSVEEEIMKQLSLSATFDIEVTSFTRLAAKTLNEKERANVLSPQGTVMLMQKAVNNVREQLKCYRAAAAYSGFAREIYAVVSDFRNHCLRAEDIYAASEKLPEYLKAKTQDIASVYNEYMTLCATRYDESSKLEKLLRVAADKTDLVDASIFVCDFYRFTNIEQRILEKLFVHSKNVTLSMATGQGRLNIDTLLKLKQSALRLGVKSESVRVEEKLQEGKRELRQFLFSYEKPLYCPANAPALFEAQTKEQEIERVCEEICQRVRDGARYQDFAVVMGKREHYEDVIESVFTRYEIPFYLDKHYPLYLLSCAAFLISAWECAYGNFQKEKVLSFLKNPLFDVDLIQKDVYENYLRKYARFGAKFNAPVEEPFREIHNKITGLSKLFRKQKATAKEFCDSICEFLKLYEVKEKNETLSERMRQEGVALYDVNGRAMEKLDKLLNETACVLGEETMRQDAFFACLKAALTSAELSSVPLYRDTVYIGDSEETRYSRKKEMFLVGASQGCFPQNHQREGILGKNEEDALELVGLSLAPKTKERSVFEKFYLSQLCLLPDTLQISYALEGGAYASLLAEEVKRIFKIEAQSIVKDERVYSKSDAKMKLACAMGAVRSFLPYPKRAAALEKVLDISFDMPLQNDFIANGKQLFFGSNATTKVSELENYAVCPYRHFLEYGLKLKEREEGEMRPTDTGSILHELLELFFKEGIYRSMQPQDAEAVCARLLKEVCSKEPFCFLVDENDESMRLLVKEGSFILKELGRLSRLSAFEPVAFELAFGFLNRDIELKGKSGVALRGKVDRIDRLGDRVVIIDYKTGRSDGSLKNVYFGKKLQLYLYLGAVEKLWKVRPAAVFYLGVNDKYEKEEETLKRFRYKGQFLNDMEIVKNLDTSLNENKTVSEILPVTFNKDFEIDKRCKNAISEQDFADLTQYALLEAATFADEIQEGYKGKKPLKENGLACQYCPYGEMCAQSGEIVARSLPSAGLEEIKEAVKGDA